MNNLTEYKEYLISAKITGGLTKEEEQDFERLFMEDAAFKKAFEDFKLKFPESDIDSSFARFKQPDKWKDLTGDFKRKRLRIIYYRTALAAAIITGVIFSGRWIFNNQQKQNTIIASVAVNEKILLRLNDGKEIDLSSNNGTINTQLITLNNDNKTLSYSGSNKTPGGSNKLIVPTGKDYKIILSDGTIVWLNSATELEFPFNFNGSTREIKINGEAYLEIAKNNSQPFIVHLPGSSVQVLGTAFNVNSYDSATVKVSLVNGAVKVKTNKDEVAIKPGNEAVSSSSGNIQIKEFNAKHILSWRNGEYYFQNANLKEIGKVLKRWYGIEVIIDNQNIAEKEFTGVVNKNKPISVFTEDIKAMSGVSSFIDNNNILHFK
jgi:transmembrane sensor